MTSAKQRDAETTALWLEMFRKMVRIRLFERAAFELYTAGKLPGFMHISIGQEATAVGTCSALRPDVLVSVPVFGWTGRVAPPAKKGCPALHCQPWGRLLAPVVLFARKA